MGKFNIASYNLGGLDGQGNVLLSELCSAELKVGVILVQEHWLSPDRMTHLQNFDPFFTSFGISGMEKQISMGILKGRPFGGAAILVHNSLLRATASILITERVNVICIGNILIINIYCPSSEIMNRPITESLLIEIGSIIELYPNHDVIMGGDFNMDLREATALTNQVHVFRKKYKLNLCYDVIKTNCEYTFFRDSLGQRTMIDFFLCSNSLKSKLHSHAMLDNLLNYSDHLPLMVGLNIDMNPVLAQVLPPSPRPQSSERAERRLRWDHANVNKYCDYTFYACLPILDSIDTCLNDFRNKNNGSLVGIYRVQIETIVPNAKLLIETVYNDIVTVLEEAAAATIPTLTPHNLKHWWSAELNNLKKDAQTAFIIWRGANKPKSGLLFEKYTSAKKDFRTAIRNQKKRTKTL